MTTALFVLFTYAIDPPPPVPSPPPPNPSFPPPPPSDTWVSNDALLGCDRAKHKYSSYSYHYDTGDHAIHYKYERYNATGLHDFVVNVDLQTCQGRASVYIPHAENGHAYSLYTSSSGETWELRSTIVYQVDSPPPPAPSPPPPSPPLDPPSPPPPPTPSPPPPLILLRRRLQEVTTVGMDRVFFTEFEVTKEPMYVRTCINCDGSCNGIDTIDSLVTCNVATSSGPSVPWWVWIFVAATAVLLVVVGVGCARYCTMNSSKQPTPVQSTGSRPMRSVQVRRP